MLLVIILNGFLNMMVQRIFSDCFVWFVHWQLCCYLHFVVKNSIAKYLEDTTEKYLYVV